MTKQKQQMSFSHEHLSGSNFGKYTIYHGRGLEIIKEKVKKMKMKMSENRTEALGENSSEY